jgi:hypothetical protein
MLFCRARLAKLRLVRCWPLAIHAGACTPLVHLTVRHGHGVCEVRLHGRLAGCAQLHRLDGMRALAGSANVSCALQRCSRLGIGVSRCCQWQLFCTQPEFPAPES